jgi:molybdate transport system substrate-binding protein
LVVVVAALLSIGCPRAPERRTLVIAAAADLNFALERVSQQFRGSHPGVDVQVVYGSSGNFYSQIENQAPFDLFLSADVEYPRKLVGEGLAVRDSLFIYGVGRIVVWVPAHSPLNVAELQMRTLESDAVQHVAIGNPRHAPYGRAAEAAMRNLGVYDRVAGKLVLGENIAQAMQFVQSGAADAGIVALSLAVAPAVRGQGRYWEVPLDAYPRMEQGGVILTRAAGSKTASEFRSFLLSAEGGRILREYGFYLPEN